MAAFASRKRVRYTFVQLHGPVVAQVMFGYGSEHRSDVRIDLSGVSQRAVCVFGCSPSVAEDTPSVMPRAL